MLPVRRFIVVSLSFLIFVGGATSAGEREQVETLLASRRYREAQELVRSILDRGSDKGSTLSENDTLEWRATLAAAYGAEGDFEEAATEYRRLLGKGPDEFGVAIALELAQCCLEMWDPSGARTALESVTSWPSATVVPRLQLLATADFMSERYDDAHAKFSQVAVEDPISLHYLGLLAYRRGEHEIALAYFRKSLVVDPRDYVSALHEVLCLIELDRLDGAQTALKRIEQFANTAEVSELFGRIQLRSGRYEQAEKRFRDALQRSPAHLESAFGLGTALRRQGRVEESRNALRRFRALLRKSQSALRRAYVLDQNVRSVTEREGGDEAAPSLLARHYLESGDPESAERVSWHAIRSSPTRIEPRLTLARALARMGRHGQAALHYQRILRERPDYQPARVELEELIRRHGHRSTGGATKR